MQTETIYMSSSSMNSVLLKVTPDYLHPSQAVADCGLEGYAGVQIWCYGGVFSADETFQVPTPVFCSARSTGWTYVYVPCETTCLTRDIYLKSMHTPYTCTCMRMRMHVCRALISLNKYMSLNKHCHYYYFSSVAPGGSVGLHLQFQ